MPSQDEMVSSISERQIAFLLGSGRTRAGALTPSHAVSTADGAHLLMCKPERAGVNKIGSFVFTHGCLRCSVTVLVPVAGPVFHRPGVLGVF